MDTQQKHSKWKIWSVSFLPKVRRSATTIWTSPTDTATHGEGLFSFRLADMLVLRKTLPIALRYLLTNYATSLVWTSKAQCPARRSFKAT